MKYLSRTLIILLTSFFTSQFFLFPIFAYADDHNGQQAGGWDLVKIVSVSSHNDKKPLLKKGIQINLINGQFTIWPYPSTNKKRGNLDVYCHPEMIDGFEFKDNYTNDERLKSFLEKIGGIYKLNKILKNNFYFSINKLNFAYKSGKSKDGKEPCKSIENTNFYMSKDMKYVFMFIYPYIYQFEGVFGYIDGKPDKD